MKGSNADQWKIREQHMIDTFKTIRSVFDYGKAIILCHNSHAQSSQCVEIMTLATYIPNCYVIGMIGYTGSLLSADKWNGKFKIIDIDKSGNNTAEGEIFNKNKKDIFLLFEDQIDNNTKGYRAFGAVTTSDGYLFDSSLKCSFDVIICVRYMTPIHYIKY